MIRIYPTTSGNTVVANRMRLEAERDGAAQRIEAAQAKRDRKNAKRRRDSIRSLIGSKVSRQLLDAA